MKSIKIFLVVVLLATITLMVFLSELQGYRLNLASAEKLFDRQLADTAHLLAGVWSREMENRARVIETGFIGFQIWEGNKLRLRSKNMPDDTIAKLEEGYQEHNFKDHRWRTYSYHDRKTDAWILTAQKLDLRYTMAENIIIKSLFPTLLILPLGGFLIWVIVGYGLYPLKKLTINLNEKRADDLSPLPADDQPAELKQVVQTINQLLSRLEASFLREKRFTADAAHELRTPISALKVHLHNLEKHVSKDDGNLQEIKSAADRMGYLVEQILIMNRTAPEQFMAQLKKVDLRKIVQEVMAKEYPAFEEKDIQLEFDGSSCFINGDQFALETMLSNLLRNASQFTPVRGSVHVSVQSYGGKVELAVQDSGPGVSEEERERLFDRFYRLSDQQKASGIPGCGLGLAIVHQIVDLHMAEITLEDSFYETGLKVKVVFPECSPEDGAYGTG